MKSISVFTDYDTKYPGQYRKVTISVGEKFLFQRFTGFTEVGTLNKVFKNGAISVSVFGKRKVDKYERTAGSITSEGVIHLNVFK